ncbi:MAG: bifunctional transaldolase/phosoglucose isomerase [Anaerolineae bacterium]|jgi:transaldolase / glucose-6-phosphate isomerase|nr:bifunctional transaldolase/phosoglucose isomerase [Anaerolineae bacterium]MBT7069943.1 bifunctional transaldolase/phosoglucose isomerase [Anaerolineae bacterium]MBT7325654.1 bifunctional transaldolase/phosoglucose isomerase [Anaerolineae bacterium]
MSESIKKLTSLGQSIWYDNIQRKLLENGELAAMIERGDIRGVTSNPSIFQNAIAKSNDYDAALIPLAWAGWDAESIFWQLAIEDIQDACDIFTPLYEESEGRDGYVSLEVSPYLANDTDGTVKQAQELWARVNRPNLMIKIPATKAGLPAIRKTIAAGINVNVTLIFSIERYREVMDAYMSGLEDRVIAEKDENSIERVHSVASFFISRLDSIIDKQLPADSPLRGKIAVANAKAAYEAFQEVASGARFGRLQLARANYQRPLWASTSTKDPAYPDTLYIDELIGPATVNTVPPATLEAFKDHGKAAATLTADLDAAHQALADLAAAGISLDQATQDLEDAGVKSFADAFTDLLNVVDERRAAAVSQLGPLQASVAKQMAKLEADSVNSRLWAHDPTLWTDNLEEQAEVKRRLGWLDLPNTSRELAQGAMAFAAEVKKAGINKTLLLGMGGSSLGPEVMARTFGISAETFAILDSTDPAQVADARENFPPSETLYIVASKSGGTAETMSAFFYFWEQSGGDGSHFVAITDPGSRLEKLAKEQNFRNIFLADSNVGGRYSALTAFGLVPAALLGVDVNQALDYAAKMMDQSQSGMALGAVMGAAALAGRDKVTILTDDTFSTFGTWAEQLVAESTGKKGKGILPIEDEPAMPAEKYPTDRLFVYLCSDGSQDDFVAQLREAGQPVLEILTTDHYSLFAEFYRWEYATAIACHILSVNAFDQPNVEDAKVQARAQIDAYNQSGVLDDGVPAWKGEDAKLYANVEITGASLNSAFDSFVTRAQKGDYISIHAYLPRNEEITESLAALRHSIQQKTGLATTLGFGPRFLHSTGQLHKGGANNGLFIQLTTDSVTDIDIPTQGLSFGTLERAQALGDYAALDVAGRRVLRVYLDSLAQLSEL